MRSKIGAALAATLFWALALVAPVHAAFPGANGKIAFEASRSIHTVNSDGTGETTIVGPFADDVAWSADGNRIAYDDGVETIYVANADGSGARNIGATGIALNPAWSPDGRIAYESSRVDCFGDYDCEVVPDGIFVINPDGSGDHRLTTHGFEPAWSPDGTKVAFTDYTLEGPSEIYVMNADGSGITNVTRTDTASEESPAWSPDGSKIAFTRSNAEIWVMNVDGSGQARVAAGSDADRYPAWSPDGTKITFESDRRSYDRPECPCLTPVIVLMDTNGANQADVALGEKPDWQPLPGPQRSDYKNAAQFCKAEREFLGDAAFSDKYGGGANAHGKCVSAR